MPPAPSYERRVGDRTGTDVDPASAADDDDEDGKVDVKSIGSISSLRSRFENTVGPESRPSSIGPGLGGGPRGKQAWTSPSQRGGAADKKPFAVDTTNSSSSSPAPALAFAPTSTPIPTTSAAKGTQTTKPIKKPPPPVPRPLGSGGTGTGKGMENKSIKTVGSTLTSNSSADADVGSKVGNEGSGVGVGSGADAGRIDDGRAGRDEGSGTGTHADSDIGTVSVSKLQSAGSTGTGSTSGRATPTVPVIAAITSHPVHSLETPNEIPGPTTVSSLRNMFDRPTPPSSRPPSGPSSRATTPMPSSSLLKREVPRTERPSLETREASSVGFRAESDREGGASQPGTSKILNPGSSSSSNPNSLSNSRPVIGRSQTPPPPPPPLHSRPKVDLPVKQDLVIGHHESRVHESVEAEKDMATGVTTGGGRTLMPPPPTRRRNDTSGAFNDQATEITFSRSPEPFNSHLDRNETDDTSDSTLRGVARGMSNVEHQDRPSGPLTGSASVPPVLPPRQTSGSAQPSSVPLSTSTPAPALPPRTPGPPTLPDRNLPDQNGRTGLSRSSSLAVGRTQQPPTRTAEAQGHASRTDSLKGMVKRSTTVLGRHAPGHGHLSQRHGVESHAVDFEPESADLTGKDEWVPPPPPVRGGSTSSTASTSAVAPRPTRSLDRYDSEEDVVDEEDDEGEIEPDPAASAALQSGSRGIANLKSSANRALAEYPDSTRVNRRVPDFVPRQRVTLGGHHHAHCFAVSGHKLCTGGHNVKVFDLTLGDGKPILTVEPRHAGLDSKGKDIKMTSMSFRSPATSDEEGRYLWCGTNMGHLWELDTLTGEITDVKAGLHSASITHVFRHDEWMVTLDELGKVNVFGPFTGGEEVSRRQTNAPCRSLRTADRQNFATMLGGQLWTASGPAARSTTNSALRGPTLRIYDPSGVTSGNTAGKTTFTSEWTGAVTAATFDPFDKQSVYLAHEGGYVSIFDRDSLACRQVLKISPTDILGLEYVGDYLWAGTRGGTINVYDTRTSPWTTINTWVAHPELPIQKIYADPYSIDQSGKYAVWTWARDALHAWDGLLSVDWIETAMQEREAEYCRFRDLTVLISSWNIDSCKPGDLSGSIENQSFLQECITSVDSPDVIVFGWQEVIDLNSRKLTAKTMLFGNKSKQDGRGNTDGVSRAYRDWQDKLQMAVRMNTPPECGYTMLDAESMVGLMTVVFVKSSLRDSLRDVAITTIKRGIGGVYGNKGAVVARMTIDDSSVCFINVHLAAGQSHKAARNADVAGILEEKAVFSTSDTGKSYVNGGDGSAILDHETVFLNGDLNYRIDQRRDNVISSVNAGDLDYLLEHDQLRKEIKSNTSFRLRAFHEAPITFAPTYKYTPNSIEYDQSEKKRIPAWCDRILWKSRQDERIECLHYRRYEPTTSDHRPISAAFKLTAKSIVPSSHASVRTEVERAWFQREGDLMQRIVDALEDHK